MKKDSKRRRAEEELYLLNRDLKLIKQYRVPASSGKPIPMSPLNGAGPTTMWDANAEITDHGRYTVFGMKMQPAASVTQDDLRAHTYYIGKVFMVNASIEPEEDSIVLIKTGNIYQFRVFNPNNEIPIVGVLKQMIARMMYANENN